MADKKVTRVTITIDRELRADERKRLYNRLREVFEFHASTASTKVNIHVSIQPESEAQK